VKRYPSFDPPEYLDWEPDPGLLSEYYERLASDRSEVDFLESLPASWFIGLYRNLLRTRLVDVGLKRWVKQGVISKAWLGTGEEAVTVGAVAALDPGRDLLTPLIRNAGACHMMGMELADLFRGYLATADSPSGGRDLHVGDAALGVIQPISHMGANVPVIAGVALALQITGRDAVALTWIGDGATRTGECHEGLNLAAVRNVPAVFIIQDNQVALGTRREDHGNGDLEAWGAMYGIPSRSVDGNNVLEVHLAVRDAVRTCRIGEGPRLVHCKTFRMGGHATHDEREARSMFSPEVFQAWGRRDPVGLYEAYLTGRGVPPEDLAAVEMEVTAEVDAAAELALASRDLSPDPETAQYLEVSDPGRLVGISSRIDQS
jgi:TPP-dependent pyruvate/acetoin dehydrogenase alpha subunit